MFGSKLVVPMRPDIAVATSDKTERERERERKKTAHPTFLVVLSFTLIYERGKMPCRVKAMTSQLVQCLPWIHMFA